MLGKKGNGRSRKENSRKRYIRKKIEECLRIEGIIKRRKKKLKVMKRMTEKGEKNKRSKTKEKKIIKK